MKFASDCDQMLVFDNRAQTCWVYKFQFIKQSEPYDIYTGTQAL